MILIGDDALSALPSFSLAVSAQILGISDANGFDLSNQGNLLA